MLDKRDKGERKQQIQLQTDMFIYNFIETNIKRLIVIELYVIYESILSYHIKLIYLPILT